jgi:thiol-disulfide isomerase/thioredoxin
MKKTIWSSASIIVIIMLFSLINGCKIENNKNDYLRKVLNNLEQIKSATYYNVIEIYDPGDTLLAFTRFENCKEYSNPGDTALGSSYIIQSQQNTSKMDFCYDGIARITINWNEKTISIDSSYRIPFAPFFNYAKSIIKYALVTKDSCSMDLKEFEDSIQFRLVIFADKQVEFHGKPYYFYNPFFGDQVSKYDIWINKSNNLPYRIRREMSQGKFVWNCSNVEINKIKIEDFVVSDYFPPGFTIKVHGRENTIVKSNLEGKVAPDWSLKDVDNKTVALKDLKSKVIMIQFSGIGCGPCYASIPFLKQFVIEYKDKDFEFISIETWRKDIESLKRHQNNNDLNYKFLMSTDVVTKSYQADAVPKFFILDKNRVIKKVISGYSKGTTDKEIRDAINALI